jgi:hypothetical protein
VITLKEKTPVCTVSQPRTPQFKLTRRSCFKELLLLQLLDGVLGLVDVLLVFQEGPDEEWMEMAKMTFGEF